MIRRLLAVVLLLGAGLVVAPPAGAAEPVRYGGFRVVRANAGDPVVPLVTLPAGYEIVPGAANAQASRAEYYAFVRGPSAAAVPVTVTLPGLSIVDVISGKAHVPVTRDPGDPYTIHFVIPVTGTSINQNTLQVYSYPSGSTAGGIYWRIEHNDPDRRAGPWTTVAWPQGQTRAVINYMIAADLVLRDSGLGAEARRRGHFYALMGFETNNALHPDNPPHWHLSYYPGLTFGAARAHVPHFWVDAQGRTFYNGMDVQGQGPRRKFYAGDPAEIRDAAGTLIVTLTIRADGGVDIDPPHGPRYSITARDDDFSGHVRVLRDGVPWRWVGNYDAVTGGTLVTQVGGLSGDPYRQILVYRYDRLTGTILKIEDAS